MHSDNLLRLYTDTEIPYNIEYISKGEWSMIDVNEREMIDKLIDKYIDLQRINKADDPKKEVIYQMTVTKAKLEAFGIVTEDLELK